MSYQQVNPPFGGKLFDKEPRYELWNSRKLATNIGFSRATLLLMLVMYTGLVYFFVLFFQHLAICGHFHWCPELERVTPSSATDNFPTTTVPTTTTTNPTPCGKRVVGYYTEFESNDITNNQLEKLTHAVFAYVEMSWDGSLRFKNSKAKHRFLTLIDKSKKVKSDVKVMISIGGEENSQYFSAVTVDSRKRRIFVKSIVTFLEDYQIDGVDFYWKRAAEKDKWNYISLLRELRQRLEGMNKTYIISATVPAAGIENWEMAYDMDQTLEYVDFVNVFSMDYYGPWPNQWGTPAGPTAPLYSGVGARTNFNVDWTMQYFVCKTRKPDKFNIVIPFFARLWKNVTEAVEPGKEVYRNAELKDNRPDGAAYMSRWTVEQEGLNISNAKWDEESKTSYIYNSKTQTYLSFETEKSIHAKKNYAIEMNLGGIWIWSVDMDDEKNSLLNMMASEEFCSERNEGAVKYNC